MPIDGLLAAHGRVDRHGEGEPQLLRNHGSGGLQGADDHPHREPDEEPDGDLADEQADRRRGRAARGRSVRVRGNSTSERRSAKASRARGRDELLADARA